MVANKFWIHFPKQLFSNFNIIPYSNLNFESQINAITRLLFISCIVLIILGFKYAIPLFLILLFIIILFYYIRKQQMNNTENFCNSKSGLKELTKNAILAGKKAEIENGDTTLTGRILSLPQECEYCNVHYSLDNIVNNTDIELSKNNKSKRWISPNQKLVGKPNPKTQVSPAIIAPIADLDFWKVNNLITFSQINETTNTDLYASGYYSSTCCPNPIAPAIDVSKLVPLDNRIKIPTIVEGFETHENYAGPLETTEITSNNSPLNTAESASTNFDSPIGLADTASNRAPPSYNTNIMNNLGNTYSYPYLTSGDNKKIIDVQESGPGWLNLSCGYDPNNIKNNLPTNFPAGNCTKLNSMNNFNDNIFTNSMQPNTFEKSQIIEPISSNIGISFQQQNAPVTQNIKDNGEVMFVKHDPRLLQPAFQEVGETNAIKEQNVYDGRLTGSGTSYRSYTEPITGQTRFLYDDINSARQGNYLVKSNIDWTNFSDKSGTFPPKFQNGNPNNNNIRRLANNAFLNATLRQRTELQERLMQKSNKRRWQEKMYPKHFRNMSFGGNWN